MRGHRVRARHAHWWLFGFAVAVSGCTPPPPDEAALIWGDERLQSGERVASAFGPGEVGVVLLVRPGDCFRCVNVVPSWMQWRRQHPDHVRLYLAAVPTSDEATTLSRLRIQVDGLLAEPPGAATGSLPVELLVANGVIRYEARIVEGELESELFTTATEAGPAGLKALAARYAKRQESAIDAVGDATTSRKE